MSSTRPFLTGRSAAPWPCSQDWTNYGKANALLQFQRGNRVEQHQTESTRVEQYHQPTTAPGIKNQMQEEHQQALHHLELQQQQRPTHVGAYYVGGGSSVPYNYNNGGGAPPPPAGAPTTSSSHDVLYQALQFQQHIAQPPPALVVRNKPSWT
ncbi:unnamed protein product, partial [Amoebophrya sp. A120]|eukprot:GSA120T00008445001.1